MRICDMIEFSSVVSLKDAEDACRRGHLTKAFLLPSELGGQDRPDNVVYIPSHISEMKNSSTAELLSAIRGGMSDVAIVPEYRGMSFVPAKITITAAIPGMPPGYKLEIGIW
jgi:hypothetical protein